jgi:hypothetical protein
MANEVVNKDDLHDVRDLLSEQIRLGFGSITARLDVLNGRVGKVEIVDAEHRVRIEALERDRAERNRSQTQQVVSDDQTALSRRDLKVAVAVLSALYVIAQVLFKVLPLITK